MRRLYFSYHPSDAAKMAEIRMYLGLPIPSVQEVQSILEADFVVIGMSAAYFASERHHEESRFACEAQNQKFQWPLPVLFDENVILPSHLSNLGCYHPAWTKPAIIAESMLVYFQAAGMPWDPPVPAPKPAPAPALPSVAKKPKHSVDFYSKCYTCGETYKTGVDYHVCPLTVPCCEVCIGPKGACHCKDTVKKKKMVNNYDPIFGCANCGIMLYAGEGYLCQGCYLKDHVKMYGYGGPSPFEDAPKKGK